VRRLPDDSREADERVAERRLRDLGGRVKAARAARATHTAHPRAQATLEGPTGALIRRSTPDSGAPEPRFGRGRPILSPPAKIPSGPPSLPASSSPKPAGACGPRFPLSNSNQAVTRAHPSYFPADPEWPPKSQLILA
jgi:hypothetical protein